MRFFLLTTATALVLGDGTTASAGAQVQLASCQDVRASFAQSECCYKQPADPTACFVEAKSMLDQQVAGDATLHARVNDNRAHSNGYAMTMSSSTTPVDNALFFPLRMSTGSLGAMLDTWKSLMPDPQFWPELERTFVSGVTFAHQYATTSGANVLDPLALNFADVYPQMDASRAIRDALESPQIYNGNAMRGHKVLDLYTFSFYPVFLFTVLTGKEGYVRAINDLQSDFYALLKRETDATYHYLQILMGGVFDTLNKNGFDISVMTTTGDRQEDMPATLSVGEDVNNMDGAALDKVFGLDDDGNRVMYDLINIGVMFNRVALASMSEKEVLTLLKACQDHLNPGGKLVISEWINHNWNRTFADGSPNRYNEGATQLRPDPNENNRLRPSYKRDADSIFYENFGSLANTPNMNDTQYSPQSHAIAAQTLFGTPLQNIKALEGFMDGTQINPATFAPYPGSLSPYSVDTINKLRAGVVKNTVSDEQWYDFTSFNPATGRVAPDVVPWYLDQQLPGAAPGATLRDGFDVYEKHIRRPFDNGAAYIYDRTVTNACGGRTIYDSVTAHTNHGLGYKSISYYVWTKK